MLKKELNCIEVAHDTRLAAAEMRLAELQDSGASFENPINSPISWNEIKSDIDSAKKVALIPIVLLMVILVLLLCLLLYLDNLKNFYQQKWRIRKDIKVLKSAHLSRPVPNDKNLSSLWELHGLDEEYLNAGRRYRDDECLSLLNSWLEILYGEVVSSNLDIKSKYHAMLVNRGKAIQSFQEDVDPKGHLSFVPPIDSLILEISEELPTY